MAQNSRVFDFYPLEDRILLSGEGMEAAEAAADAGVSAALMTELDAAEGDASLAVAFAPPRDQEDPEPTSDDRADTPSDDTNTSLQVVFVDAGVDDAEVLIEGLRSDGEEATRWLVVEIAADRDGVEQITETLAGLSDIDAVHILSHGDGNGITLGNTRLDADNAYGYAGEIASWGNSLEAGADMLVYGCDLASTFEGRELIHSLAALCDCDVAASDDRTGHQDLAGDWDLEYTVGSIETQVAFTEHAQQSWMSSLATITVTTTSDTDDGDTSSIANLIADAGADGVISLREAIIAANNTVNGGSPDEIHFSITGAGPHVISLAAALPDITEAVIIDGTTEPDFSGAPVIRIDGNSAGGSVDGLSFNGGNDSSVLGLMITRFSRNGIQIDSGTDGVTILGTWIGTTGTGSTGVGNGNNGINVQGNNTVIGGTGSTDGNVITNNGNEGINLSNATDTVIRGNIIGLDADGSTGGGNSDVGIAVLSGSDNTIIGGTAAGAGNVISMNFEGIEINSDNNIVQGNLIGTDIGGTLDRGNRNDDGVEVQNNAVNNLIGGTVAGAGNIIGFNALDGVNIVSGANNTVVGNQIFSNGGLGIELGPNGVTGNDVNDGDTGANDLLNFPVLTQVDLNGSNLVLSGTLDTDKITTDVRLEFYGNVAGTEDPSNGEARIFLGSTTVTTDGSGDATFTLLSLAAQGLVSGDYVTVTATEINDPGQVGIDDQAAYGSTSEFAANVAATQVNAAPTVGLPGGSVSYGEGDPASVIDSTATFNDPDGGDFDGGTLTIDFTAGGTTDDRLAIRNQGTGSGQIGVSGSNVTYEGTTIGTFSGGTDGSTPLVITLNTNSSNTSVQALMRNITFENVGVDPDTDARTVRFVATDGDGATSNAATTTISVSGDNTLVVTTTSDVSDGATSSIDALLADRGADGVISLREAIEATNNTAGADIIEFAIAGTGTHTILATAALPTISDQVTIDATTDDSFAANANRPAIAWVGTSAGGGSHGFVLGASADGSEIRGLVISDWDGSGIVIQSGSENNLIAGNYIGSLNTSGADAGAGMKNGADGILVQGNNNTIGGSTAADRNVISGNSDEGIDIDAGVSGTTIQGNYVGTDATGTSAIANGQAGIGNWGGILVGGDNTTIGGSGAGEGNLISGNNSWGIIIEGTNNVMQGNLVGTAADGTSALGNSGVGVVLSDFSGGTNNIVGGIAANEGNTIAFNGLDGVRVDGGSDNPILGNLIHSNSGLAINLVGGTEDGNGVTSNDVGDGDSGPNGLQNYAVITSAVTDGSSTITISGSINSTASTDLRIEFFASDTADLSGHGEAKQYLGSTTVTTDGSGDATFTVPLSVTLAAGEFITAVATVDLGGGNYGSSSELAQNIVATSTGTNTLVVDTTSDVADGDTSSIGALLADKGADGQISLREAIAATNNTANGTGADQIHFNIGTGDSGYVDPDGIGVNGDEYWTIALTSYLGWITDTVIIDATTQPEYDSGTGRPVIELDGTAASGATTIIGLRANDSTIRGFSIHSSVDEAIEIDGTGGFGQNNTIQGNWIGIDAEGNIDANTEHGVIIVFGATGNLIGGTGAGEGNVIAGNGLSGIFLRDSGTANNTIQGNLIGMLADGITPAANGRHGIEIASSVTGTTIGGTGAGEGNVIAHNTGDGVSINSDAGSSNAILGNQIYSNGDLGIDLEGGTEDANGVTANDNGDADSGANGLTNFAVVYTATISGGNVTITGEATAGSTVEFYKSTLDGSGYGEGSEFIGRGVVGGATPGTVDPAMRQFSFVFSVGTLTTADLITSTTTDTANNTSEFSASIDVNDPPTDINPNTFGLDEGIDTSGGYSLGTLSTVDPDTTDSFTYTILAGLDGSKFTIGGGGSDELILTDGTTDFESKSSYSVTVRTTDSAGETYDETLTVNVNDLNDAPTLSGSHDLTTINEDDVGSPGTLVSGLIAGQVSDSDAGALTGIAIVGVDDTNGTWEYSTDGGSTWAAVGAVDDANARLLAADANTYVRFVPDANFNGTVTNGITFHAWDQTTGTNGGTADLTSTYTLRDEFATASFGNNDGTASWSGDWQELGEANGPGSGNVQITGSPSALQIGGNEMINGDGLLREADLSQATSATLTFDAWRTAYRETASVTISVSDDGGSTWTDLQTLQFSTLSSAPTLQTFDISAYLSADTQIRFLGSGEADSANFYADNVQIEYTTDNTGGTTAFSTATASSSITVTAVNDDPVITSDGGGSTASVNVDENTTSVTTVTATDVDGDTPAYSISGGADAAKFAIDANSGALSFIAAPDFEAPADADTDNVYEVEVTVSDGQGGNAVQTISVAITDVNETSVTAVSDTDGTANAVDENATVGSDVGITAFAEDADGTDTVTYALDDDAGGRFTIDANSGVVTVAGMLDRETAASHNITVRAASSDGSSSTALMTINVNDVNESPVGPVSDSDGSANAVNENAANGTTVGVTALATDADATNNTITYTLDDNAGGRFTIDGTTGVVTVADGTLLDRETTASHNITVRAASSDGSSSTAVMTINVNDVNESPVGPVSDSDGSANAVNENAANGTTVGVTALATDADATNNTITYTLDDNAGGRFTIDGSTGVVTVADGTLLDRETTASHNITVRAASSDGSSSTAVMTINVNDVNESPVGPVSDSDGSANAVNENAANGTTVGVTALATDADATNNTITYTLDDNAGGRFTIDGSTGVVTVADGTLLDRETAASHNITVRAASSDGSSSTALMTINVNDVNESPVGPVSDSDGAANAVNENAANGTTVGVTALATDADATNNTITYTLDDNAGGRFAIDGSTGVVTVADGTLLDRETAASHNITVRAASSDGSSSTALMTINVNDVNESPVGPVSDSDGAANAVNENAANGTTVGVTALATDADATNNTITYTLDDNAGGRFTIDGSTGVVTVADGTLLDRETAASHNITVRAASSDGSSSTAVMTINVNDVNESPVGPVSDSDGSANAVNENAANGTTVGVTALATDADATNNTITYSLDDNAGGRFTIDGSTGVVTVADGTLLDRETAASHNITVRAASSDGSSSTALMTINVNDVNESPVGPVSDSDGAANAVNENAANGTSVGVTALATDADATNNTITYTLDDNAGGRFAIDGSTGVVTVADGTLLDRETAASHNITVRAASSDGSSSTAVMTINVNDVNESPVGPVSDSDGAANAVNENAANGTTVGVTALATDADATDTITYTLDDNAGGRFAIDGSTGVVTVADGTLLDRETAASHNITVRAASSDGSSSTAVMTINVNDVDESPVGPVSDSDGAANAVNENAANGTTVGVTALATDSDATDTITYTLDDNAGGRFAIDGTTGVVTVADGTLLDRETGASHNITVRAASSDGSSSTAVMTINVNDVDESPVGPVTDVDATGNTVDENAAVGTTVGITASANDPDATNNTITYSLQDNDGGRFGVDSATGVVTVNGPIDREVDGASRNITVRATSSDGSFSDQVFVIGINDLNESPVGAPVDVDASPNAVDEHSAVGTVVGITAFAIDPDATNNTITYSLDDSAGGRFAIDSASGLVTVSGALDYEVTSSHNITVRATSSDGSSATSVFVIAVNDIFEVPVAIDDVFDVISGTTMTTGTPGVLANDYDLDGDPVTAVLVSGPANGTATLLADGTLIYTPTAGFFGTDIITYQASDGVLLSNVATIEVNVAAVGPTSGGGSPEPDPPPEPADEPEPEIPPDSEPDSPPDGDDEPADVEGDEPTERASTPTPGGTPRAPGPRGDGDGGFGGLDEDDRREALERRLIESAIEAASQGYYSDSTRLILVAQEYSAEIEMLERLLQLDLEQAIVWQQWDQSGDEYERSSVTLIVGSAGTAAGLFSVGYVLWALRGGAIVTAAASSLPAWRLIDPAALLTAYRETQARDRVDQLLE